MGVSRRTFSRAFAKHAGVTPSVFVDQIRVDFARKLLQETDLPLKTIAFRSGFHNAAQMRMTFARQMSTTPALYRERIRASEVPDEPAMTRLGKKAKLVGFAAFRPRLMAAPANAVQDDAARG
jgi:AraC-like DNA-binding protein